MGWNRGGERKCVSQGLAFTMPAAARHQRDVLKAVPYNVLPEDVEERCPNLPYRLQIIVITLTCKDRRQDCFRERTRSESSCRRGRYPYRPGAGIGENTVGTASPTVLRGMRCGGFSEIILRFPGPLVHQFEVASVQRRRNLKCRRGRYSFSCR